MEITLPSDLAAFVTSKVKAGAFPTPSEVVGEGLRLLQERDELERQRLDHLRREIDRGIEQSERGETQSFNAAFVERIKARGRERRHGAQPEQV